MNRQARFERRVHRRDLRDLDPLQRLVVVSEEARRARSEDELAWMAVDLFEPLVDGHWQEIQRELKAELASNHALRGVLSYAWLHIPADVQEELRVRYGAWTPARSMRTGR